MGDKHATKGASLRKQGHAQQDQQKAKSEAAKKLARESAAEMQPLKSKAEGRKK